MGVAPNHSHFAIETNGDFGISDVFRNPYMGLFENGIKHQHGI
jgi:hypothetical protein